MTHTRLLFLALLLFAGCGRRAHVPRQPEPPTRTVSAEEAQEILRIALPPLDWFISQAPRGKYSRSQMARWMIHQDRLEWTARNGTKGTIRFSDLSKTYLVSGRGYWIAKVCRRGQYPRDTWQIWYRDKLKADDLVTAMESMRVRGTKPAPPPVVRKPVSGPLKSEGAVITIPKGATDVAAVRLETFKSYPPPGHAPRVSKVWGLGDKYVFFRKPIKVSLPYDESKIPEGATAEQIRPVLLDGPRRERIRDAKVDTERKVVEFELTRTFPMADLHGTAPMHRPGFSLEVDLSRQVKLESGSWYEFWSTRALEGRARGLIEKVKPLLRKARHAFDVDPQPPMVFVHFVNLNKAAGQASAGNTIELDPAHAEDGAAVIHEFFHLVQQTYKIRNLRFWGREISPNTVRRDAWIIEATAEFMTWKVGRVAAVAGLQCDHLRPGFTFKRLTLYEDHLIHKNPHQYKSFIFFAFLDKYFDGPELVRKFYRNFMSQPDKGIKSSHDPHHVLDWVLSSTKDKNGRTWSLGWLYATFVLQFQLYKNFEPWASIYDKDRFGERGDMRFPDSAVTPWPLRAGGSKKEMVQGDALSIARVFEIVNSDAGKKDVTGDLTLTMETGRSGNLKKALMIALPVTDKVGKPRFGTPDTPVTFKKWESLKKVFVLVLDVSVDGYVPVTLHAKFNAKDNRIEKANAAIEVRNIKPAGGWDRRGGAMEYARVTVSIRNHDRLGLDPKQFEPVQDRTFVQGRDRPRLRALLRFDYQGMSTYALTGGNTGSEFKLPVRAVGKIPVTVTAFTGPPGSPVLRSKFEIECISHKQKPDMSAATLKYYRDWKARNEQGQRQGKLWRDRVRKDGSYAVWGNYMSAVDGEYNYLKGFQGPGFIIQNADAFRKLIGDLFQEVGNPFRKGVRSHVPLIGGRFDLDLISVNYEGADAWLKRVEGWVARPAVRDPKAKYELFYIKESIHLELALRYLTYFLRADRAGDLLNRYRRFHPSRKLSWPWSQIPDEIKRVGRIRNFYPGEAFR